MSSASSLWMMPTPPALPSCPRRRTPISRNWSGGKTGRVYGDLMGLADGDEGPAPGLQQGHAGGQRGHFLTRWIRFPCAWMCLPPLYETMTVRVDKLRRAAAEGFINATDCADYLVKQGMPFRDAYTLRRETGSLLHRAGQDAGNPVSGRISHRFPPSSTRACIRPSI